MDKTHPKWMKLDNAAIVYPAAARRDWNALFRLSIELTEDIDPDILSRALERTTARFPSFAVRLRRGLFWYYFEHLDGYPAPQKDVNNPCARLRPKQNGGFAFRVRYYKKRIALEVFHVLADGTGGMSFLKTMVAEYLTMKYGAVIPRDGEVLDCDAAPDPEEYSDGFKNVECGTAMSRSEAAAYRIKGTDEADGFVHITTGKLPIADALAHARAKGVSLTEYLVAVLVEAVADIQYEECRGHRGKKLKPVKVNVPVNLRRFFPINTKRNFSNYVNAGIDPNYGRYDFDETLTAVHHFLGTEVTAKMMAARISTNLLTERNAILRVTPLFLKNAVIKLAYEFVGDAKSSTSFSNMGAIRLPAEMEKYVPRADVILGPLSRNRVICAAASYKDTLYLNFTRTIKEPKLERRFFSRLVELGIPVTIESNQRD